MSTDETVQPRPPSDDDPRRRPTGRRRRFWHRDHPVFTPLAGFFTGVLLVVVLGGLLGALLDLVVGYDVGAHPGCCCWPSPGSSWSTWCSLAPRRTRRFARYMLFGVLTTPAVVGRRSPPSTFWLLLRNDG